MPEVEAPEGSGFCVRAGCGFNCLGLTPEVGGVGKECGVLGAIETLEPVPGGDAGAGGGTGGATRGAVLAGVAGVFDADGPKG